MKVLENDYKLQGVAITEICREFGTPLYLYDTEKISRQIALFREAFSGIDLKIKYAAKALTNLNILRFMQSKGTGLDTVSVQEIHMGLKAGFQPQEILFTPNCVAFSEIKEAVEMGTAINIENIPNLEKFGKEYGHRVPCCIRLNPFIASEQDSEKVKQWHDQSKFGIAINQLEEVHKVTEKYNIHINGIHIHSSSVIMSPEVFLKGAETVFNIARQFKALEYIDFGGGIKVAHKPDDPVIDVMELGSKLRPVFKKFCHEYGRKLQLWFEPGRFLVSDSGYLLARAVLVKSNGAKYFVGVDSGFNHLIRPMMYGAYHDIINISNPGGEEKTYTVVGNICEIDNFGVDRTLNEVREGDIIAIKNAGAYGFSMASNYNSRFKPAEVMIIHGKAKLIRKRDTLVDLLKNQVGIDFV